MAAAATTITSISNTSCRGSPVRAKAAGKYVANFNWKELHVMTGGAGGLAGVAAAPGRACSGRKTTTFASAPAARGILHIDAGAFPSP
jgi:hypothetical protein